MSPILPALPTAKAVEALRRANPGALHCTVCGAVKKSFRTGGVGKARPHAKCPKCGSLERHRLFWLHLFDQIWPHLPDRKKDILHIAPEPFFVENLKYRPDVNYVSGDLMMSASMAKMDLTNIQFWDEQFDLIICSHVLEHIPNDMAAMNEMTRVLRPGGVLLVMVPTYGEKTYENFSITLPEERNKHFGQDDHVRKYGRDIKARLEKTGLRVRFWPERDDLDPNIMKFINCGDRQVLECRKLMRKETLVPQRWDTNVKKTEFLTSTLKNTHDFSDLTLGPYKKPWQGGPDLSRLPQSIRIHVGGKVKDSFGLDSKSPPHTLSGYFYYGGPLKVHFGHLLTDTISRLWAYEPNKYDGVVFSPLGNCVELPTWVLSLFEYVGIPSSQIILANNFSNYGLIKFADPGSELGSGPMDWYLDYIKQHLPIPQSMKHPKKLFLGRSHLIKKGSIIGESYFRDLILENGFSYFCPEDHTIESQVAALRDADQVLFTEGSGVYSVELLASSSAQFFMLPRRKNTGYLFEPHITRRGSHFTKIDAGPLTRLTNLRGLLGASSPTYYLNPEAAQKHLYSLGLVKDPNFNRSLYTNCEFLDSKRYFRKRQQLSEPNLKLIKSCRGW